ncbi:MAG: hypothetical protein ACHQE6_01680 [Solirubrobacterales bacterium]
MSESGMWSGDRADRESASMRCARRSACVLLPTAAALLLGACGGSSSSSSSSSSSASVPQGVVGARVQAARDVTPARNATLAGNAMPARGATLARKATPAHRLLRAGHVGPTPHHPFKARTQAGAINDEVSATGARRLAACSLVSRAQAQAILGKPVGRPAEAPQGPTCLYRPQGAKRLVTVAVISTNFSSIEPQAHLKDRMSVTVSGRVAYCGVAGAPTMIVPLTTGRFLTVAAPCPIAASFAAAALSHIKV